LTLASGLAILVVMLVTLFVEMPINRLVQRCRPDARPGD
jgi:hypothetical protein